MTSSFKDPGAYDIFKIDDLISPGRSIVTRCNGREIIWKDAQSPGLEGAFTLFQGEKLVSVTYRVEVWNDAQAQAWDRFSDYLHEAKSARPPTKLKLIDLRLKALRIPQVAVEVLPYQQFTSPGLVGYEVSFHEYRRQILPTFGHPKTQLEKRIEQQASTNTALRGEVAAAKARARAGK